MIEKRTYKTWAYRLLLLFTLSGIRSVHAQSKPPLEYQVKAAFLFNFTRFIHWPATAYVSPDSPFIIGVAGEDPFGTYLDDLMNGELVDGRKIIIRRYPNGGDMSGCHLIFFHIGDPSKLKLTLTQLNHQRILSVGDNEDFIGMGGIVHFYMEDNKVKVEIRLAAAKAAQLEISSKLLQVAKLK